MRSTIPDGAVHGNPLNRRRRQLLWFVFAICSVDKLRLDGTAVVPAVEAGSAEVCWGHRHRAHFVWLVRVGRWREIRMWVQRDVGRPNARPLNPNFLIDMTP